MHYGILERDDKEKRTESLFKEIMTETWGEKWTSKFPRILGKDSK